MERKLIKQGLGGYTIYLPKKWLGSQGLDKGGEISIEETDSSLVISSKKTNIKPETEITLKGLTETSIRTLITNAYRKGYDKIIVNFDNINQLKILQDTIQTKLIGFDIVKKEKNKCVVENITEPSPDQFDNILSKIFLNISSLFEITKQRFNRKKPEENYEEIEQRIMQYDNFCRRVISKKHIIDKKAEFLWTFLTLVIHGQREIYHLNKALDSMKFQTDKITFIEDVENIFNLLIEAYKENNTEKLEKIHELEKEIVYKKLYKSIQQNKKENIILYHLGSSVRQFYLASSPLMGLLLGR